MNNYAFIDGHNLYKRIVDMGWDLDYARFRTYLKEKYKASVAYYFIGYIKKYESLYKFLKSCGYEMVYKKTVEQEDTYKGNCDVLLTLRALIEKDDYDKAILVTNDGDFAPLVEYLHELGKMECIVACSRLMFSHLLRELRDRVNIYYLDDFLHKVKKEEALRRDKTLRRPPS
jgi:uncharacterized LabA/DUF88 family protein